MAEFAAPVDICNRALQMCRLPRIQTLNDSNPGAVEMKFAYGKIRQAELRRNLWYFAIRRCNLRVLDSATQLVNFPTYAAGTTYGNGAVVAYSNTFWVSLVDSNLGNTPGNPDLATAPTDTGLNWERYFGPVVADQWNYNNPSTTVNLSYLAGDMAWITPNDGSVKVYRSLVGGNATANVTNSTQTTSWASGNTNEPDTVDAWLSTSVYASGAVVKYKSTNYQSLVALNVNNQPDISGSQWTSTVTNPTVSGTWVQIGTSLSTAPIVYPVGAGPFTDPSTSNAFHLPHGFLKTAPADPKADKHQTLGLRSWWVDDLVVEGHYIVSNYANNTLMLRFVADIVDVTTMDPMFCEGLACRLAFEVGPVLQRESWTQIMPGIRDRYMTVMREARIANAIEEGPISPETDKYITCRV